jgi:hypothetical protein
MTVPPDDPPPIREEIIDLFTDVDPYATQETGQLVHGDGRPFTDTETRLFNSATAAELAAVSDRQAGRIEHLDTLGADGKRLYQIAWTTPDEISKRFMDALIERGLIPGGGPEPGEVPVNESERRVERNLATLIRTFRALILPNIGGPVRTEAVEILERLAPYELLDPGSEGSTGPVELTTGRRTRASRRTAAHRTAPQSGPRRTCFRLRR